MLTAEGATKTQTVSLQSSAMQPIDAAAGNRRLVPDERPGSSPQAYRHDKDRLGAQPNDCSAVTLSSVKDMPMPPAAFFWLRMKRPFCNYFRCIWSMLVLKIVEAVDR